MIPWLPSYFLLGELRVGLALRESLEEVVAGAGVAVGVVEAVVEGLLLHGARGGLHLLRRARLRGGRRLAAAASAHAAHDTGHRLSGDGAARAEGEALRDSAHEARHHAAATLLRRRRPGRGRGGAAHRATGRRRRRAARRRGTSSSSSSSAPACSTGGLAK